MNINKIKCHEGQSFERIGTESNSPRFATVKAFLTERVATVETAAGDTVHARQAASCLLAPAIGDRVLIYGGGEEAYVLAVLERDRDHAAELSVPDADDVRLKASRKLTLEAPGMTFAARELNLLARAVSQAGDRLMQNFRRITQNVGDKIVGARTITTKAENRTAVVKDVETLEAGTLIQNVDQVATQNSEISLVTARQDVRLDAKRVSVG